jgi:hypothetical protein
MYALIENGEITRYNIQLPTVVGNTSIPAGATGLEAFGLYPIVGDEPTYDPAIERMSGPQYQFDGTQVNRVFEVNAIPDAEFKAANAARAKQELLATDWCENASVRNTAVTPHLTNPADFDTYRLALRAIAIDPPVTVAEWPVRPDATWA